MDRKAGPIHFSDRLPPPNASLHTVIDLHTAAEIHSMKCQLPRLDNHRQIKLMNGLLLPLPGTPVMYYGNEVSMGDNGRDI